jgi:hypothetical protein
MSNKHIKGIHDTIITTNIWNGTTQGPGSALLLFSILGASCNYSVEKLVAERTYVSREQRTKYKMK